LVRVPVHWRTHEIDIARSVHSLVCSRTDKALADHRGAVARPVSAAGHSGP
jgi:hypothetical protein